MKCIYCGKYISNQDVNNGIAFHHYTPDSAFTVETHEFYHKACKTKEASHE